ncbi:Hypothetical_protein [Hexamita inflata]|uniref:Hypothetical_protein n=1 Tax=Hexamita inflata TaxID=28002 RepID=A0AA86V462_9EUKA|nr:Hypothetical protein HINF_LOCUS63257 [Hexamita inflata]
MKLLVIPLVLRYNGTVYEKSMNMLTTYPARDHRTPSQANTAALQQRSLTKKLRYISLITNTLHEGTQLNKYSTMQGLRDRQATGRRALRALSGLESVGARQEGEAQGNAGSDGLGVTVNMSE